MNDFQLKCETIEPSDFDPQTNAEACVIWLHGLGASGHDFVPIVPHLGLPAKHGIRFIFPHAPEIPVTCNGGYIMPAWYDILALTEIRQINVDQLVQNKRQINALIEQQIQQGIPSHRIVLAGFSQGGALAYHCALTFPKPLAGLFALSTYLPNPEGIAPQQRIANQKIPIHIAHGQWDEMVTENAAKAAYQWLLEQAYTVDWVDYPMGHEVCMAEIKQIGQWLHETLGLARL